MKGPTASIPLPERFYAIDALRGLAALAVVLNHWKHFSFAGTDAASALDRSGSPLFSWLSVLYESGWIAVDLFFCISGFVFTWIYADKIRERAISPMKFALLRFSRLYPLHFLTLVLVAIGQAIMVARTGDFFVYPFNDAYHFALNLALIPSWGLERGYSFNGPVWSVSIEILLYTVFFAVCWSRRLLQPKYVVLIAGFGVGLQVVSGPIGRGIAAFFVGTLVYYAYRWTVANADVRRVTRVAVAAAVIAWLGVAVELRYELLATALDTLSGPVLGFDQNAIGAKVIAKVPVLFVTLVVFPVSIFALSLAETVRGHLARRVAFLGDWSYGIYLLHFPLQLLVMLAWIELDLSPSHFSRPVALLGFLTLVVAAAQLSYRHVERPAQKFLRSLDRRLRATKRKTP